MYCRVNTVELSLAMIQMFRQNPELKYIGVLMLTTTVVKLVTTTIIWKEILFLAQVIFVELFLMLSFQVLSGDLMRRIVELKRLCNLTHAANMRLFRDIGSLKGMMKNIPENFPERCFDKSKRVVANVLKRKATACSNGKIISQRNKRIEGLMVSPVLFRQRYRLPNLWKCLQVQR